MKATSFLALFLAATVGLQAGATRCNIGRVLATDRFTELDGQPARITAGPLLLEQWATWCVPCVRAFPHLEELHATYAARGLQVLAVSNEESAKVSRQIGKKVKTKLPLALDPGSQFRRDVAVVSIPHTMLIAGNGVVFWEGHPAAVDGALLERFLAFHKSGLTEVHAFLATGSDAGELVTLVKGPVISPSQYGRTLRTNLREHLGVDFAEARLWVLFTWSDFGPLCRFGVEHLGLLEDKRQALEEKGVRFLSIHEAMSNWKNRYDKRAYRFPFAELPKGKDLRLIAGDAVVLNEAGVVLYEGDIKSALEYVSTRVAGR